MRFLPLLVAAVLLAGCATSSASSPTVTPTASPAPIPTPFGARFSKAPPMTINRNDQYTADVITNKGSFTIRLLPKIAPLTVNNFVFLARHHYYDNNPFSRVIANFMIQTGDPTGTGLGGPGYEFKDEPVTQKYTVGTVAMANHGPNTNGSQFFIVTGSMGLGLKPNYTIFGHVIKGMNVVEKIAQTPVGVNPGSGELSMPLTKVTLKAVVIHVQA